MRLHTMLPIMGWKRVSRITHAEAAKHTNGNTDKFTNKDYWVLGPKSYNKAAEIPIGTQAVYYHDGSWWIVQKVRN